MPSTSSAWRPSIAASKRAKLAALAALAAGLQACAAPAPVEVPREPNFFVRVFGGYFPIPSRYELAAYGASGVRLLAPSTREVLLARRRGDIDVTWSAVTITRGECADRTADGGYIVESGRSGSLGYRIFHIPAGDAYESTDAVVQIHGEAGRQCLTITGDRSGFWRESLAEFRKIDALMNEAGGK